MFATKTSFLVLTDIHTWVDQKSKRLNYFSKLKTKGKNRPFSRDSRVRHSCSEIFLKIAVPSKLAKSLKNICERVCFLVKLEAVGLQLYTKNELLYKYFLRILLTL